MNKNILYVIIYLNFNITLCLGRLIGQPQSEGSISWKIKIMKSQYFCFCYVIFADFLNCWCFFVESVLNHAAMPELPNWSAIKAWQVLSKKLKFYKTAACSHHCPLCQEHCHWYTGVYLRIYDPGPSNPTTFLELCSFGDYRQFTVSNGRPHLQFYRKGA